MQDCPRPNFFLVGAMKSGTTTLYEALRSHPDIFMSTPKEPCYFVDRTPIEKDYQRQMIPQKAENYLALFRHANPAKVVGEASTHYTKLPTLKGAAERIARFNPNAKILYLVREPAKRAIQHYWHRVKTTYETRDLMTALKEDEQYTGYSYYAMQLRPYFQEFPSSQIRVMSLESLLSSPKGVLSDLFRWLEVDENVATLGHFNKTPQTIRRVRGGKTLFGFRQSAFWKKVGPAFPLGARRFVLNLLSRPIEKESDKEKEAIRYLRKIQLPQIEELEVLLGRRFTEWD